MTAGPPPWTHRVAASGVSASACCRYGSLESVVKAGRDIRLGGPRQRAVLAPLALDAGRVGSG
jgi:hypothetical protein